MDRAILANRSKIRVFLLGGGGEAAELRAAIKELLEPDGYSILVMEQEPDEPDGDPYRKFNRILRENNPTHYFFIFLNNGSPNPGPQVEIMGLYNHHGEDREALTARTTLFIEKGWPRRGLSAYTRWFLAQVEFREFDSADAENPLEELIAGRIDSIAYDLSEARH